MEVRQYLQGVRELLGDVSSGQKVSRSHPAYVRLTSAAQLLADLAPGWRIEGSLGKGLVTATPWVAFLNPDETEVPTEGLYVVYIMTPDQDAVTLSLNQGVTAVRNQLGDAPGRDQLRAQAQRIRVMLPAHQTSAWDSTIDLSPAGSTQRLYEAGCLLGRRYDFTALPPATRMTADLLSLFELYEAAIDVKRRLLVREPGLILSPGKEANPTASQELVFEPKADGSYTVVITEQRQRRSRRHETLVREFGDACIGRGLTVGTNVHPRDAEVRTPAHTWVAEMKTVTPGREMYAVRDAHAQLAMYADLLYPADLEPRKVAVFDGPVGDGWVGYLARHGIETVWRDDGAWIGTPAAAADGLTDIPMDPDDYTNALERPHGPQT